MDSRMEIPSPEELLAHAAFVRDLAHALMPDPHEAEDVAQDAMGAFLKHSPTISQPAGAPARRGGRRHASAGP